MKQIRLLTALAIAALTTPMTSGAAVTQLISFDDAGNGWAWYSDADRNFLFNPANINSSANCADNTLGSGNGSCVLEGKGQNGQLPLMTRPTTGTTKQGDSNDPPDASGPNLAFTLDSFYFFLTGSGTDANNAMTVTGGTGQTPGQNVMNTFTFVIGSNWDPVGAPDVTFYEDDKNNPTIKAGGLAGDLVKNTGYIATFGNLFKDVTWIQFSAPSDANSQLDCVVATFDGTITKGQKASEFAGKCGLSSSNGGPPSAGEAPEPGSSGLALLALGMMGLGFWARNKRSVQA